MALAHINHSEHLISTDQARTATKHRRGFALAIVTMCMAQAVIAAAVVMGGSIVVGVVAAPTIAICGLTLVFAAAQ